MQRYKYDRRLKENEIRLLEIARHPEDNKLQGRIRIYNLVEEKPRYEALSYLWGPSGPEVPKFPIGRQEPVFDVFENLYKALHRILSLTDEGDYRTLWIDQICINQEDTVEQKSQVLLMGEIYKRAHDVLVWLGDPPPGLLNVAGYLNQIPGIVKKIERNVARIGPNFLPSVSAGLPVNDDPVWAIMIDILHKEWYSRVWTLQEAVLGKRLVVYYGSNIVDWEFIYRLYLVYGAAPHMPLRSLHDEKEMAYKSIQWIQTYRRLREKSKPIDFSHLLWTCGFKDCKFDVDKIYGMLGMVEEDIKGGIPVDDKYKEDPRPVFLEAFKIAIKNDPQLHLLSLPFERDTKLGLPSWCPDLKRPNECVQLSGSFLAGIRNQTDKTSRFSITNSDCLSIQGVEVDKVLKIAKAQYRHLKEMDKRKKLMTEFHEETLRMAQEVYGTPEPEEYCRALIADTTRSLNGRKWTTEEMRAGYQALFAEGPLQDNLNAMEKSLSGLYTSCAIQALGGRRFITTRKGRVGLAPANCEEGDIISVFLGSGVPYVLRPNAAGAEDSSNFSFVGDCYLHGIMNSEVLDMLERKDTGLRLREFIIT
jgi:hypothetical protein